jgi:putative CocE/NonD family hydrolase
MRIEKNVFVPMRDGVRLAVDIYRPESPGRYPVVLTRTPYNKDAAPRAAAQTGGALGAALARYEGLVEAGYIVVVSDTRGTGNSEGVYDYYNYEGGPYDGYDTIEWIADQPWCDGNVGMIGASAGAILCYLAAITQPPHLKCMVPNMHPADHYFDQWFIGGVFRYQNRISWAINMLPRIMHRTVDPEEGNAGALYAVHEARFHQYYQRMRQGKNPINLDWLAEYYQQDTYSDFWRQRSIAAYHDKVAVPTLNGGVWYDHFIRGTLWSHREINVPKKLLVNPGMLGAAPGMENGGFLDWQLRWLDYWLRGVETGILDEAPVRVYLLGEERWLDLPAWPPAEAMSTPFYLRAGGKLSLDPPGAEDPDRLVHDPERPLRTPGSPNDQRSIEAGALVFSTPPLERDLIVMGPIQLVLYAATDAEDVSWCVRLCDVFPDGRSRLLNTGALKGSHHASHERPEPLEQGRVYRFEIEVWPTANVFKAGHSVRVVIAHSDFPFFENSPLPARSYVFHDAERASQLLLPVVPSL